MIDHIKNKLHILILRFIIKYLKRNCKEGLAPIFNINNEYEIIAWKWTWSVELEKKIRL